MSRKIYITEAQFKNLLRQSIIKENIDEKTVIDNILNIALKKIENKEYYFDVVESQFDGNNYYYEVEVSFKEYDDIMFRIETGCEIETEYSCVHGDGYNSPSCEETIKPSVIDFGIGNIATYIDDINVNTESDGFIDLNIEELNPELYKALYNMCHNFFYNSLDSLEYPEGYFTKEYWGDY